MFRFPDLCDSWLGVPSGKRLQNYGKLPFYSWVNQLSMAIFNSYVKLPEGIEFIRK